jgi:hypothetical protein
VTQADTNKVYAQIVAKAWADPAFKAKLLADPMTALKEAGHTVPEGLVVKTVENTDKQVYLVVPAKPRELSDAQLDAMAGGITAGDILPGLPTDLIGKF